MVTKRKRPAVEVDKDAVTELDLWASNDYPTYQQAQYIYRSLQRKFLKGTYDHNKAPKGYLYAIDKANASYKKEFGYSFPVSVRRAVAKMWADSYLSDLERGAGTI